ncbi:MAG: hypothetical protein NVS4B3_17470 [Gemmatimonadaceae bacterium]
MHRVRELAFALLLTTGLGGCVWPAPAISPFGRRATVYPTNAPRVSGELLAVSSDSLWLLRDTTILVFPADALKIIHVARHSFDGRRTVATMIVAGAVTGAALMVACGQVKNTDCGAVLPAALLTHAVLGGLFALSTDHSSMHRFSPRQWAELRGYARFPQGLPDSARVKRSLSDRPPTSGH